MKSQQTDTEKNAVAEVELVYHSKVKPADQPKVLNAGDAYKIFLAQWDKDSIELYEEFKVMLLNNRGSLLGIYNASKGGMTATFVDHRLVFAAALKAAASTIILAHNHPSGELSPSRADELLTRKFVECGTILDIKVNDHLIITPDKYFSFANEGLL